MAEIKIIKTPLHLIPLFFQTGINFHAQYFSKEIYGLIKSAQLFSKENLNFKSLISNLQSLDFEKVDRVEAIGQFNTRGDVVSFWPLGYDNPIRAEFFGDDLEQIYEYDEVQGNKLNKLENIVLCNLSDIKDIQSDLIKVENIGKENKILHKFIFTNRNIEVLNSKEYFQTDISIPQLFFSKLDLFQSEVEKFESKNYKIYIQTNHKENLPKELQKFTYKLDFCFNFNANLLTLEPSNVSTSLAAGLISESLKLAVFTDREIYGSIYLNKRTDQSSKSNIDKLLRQLEGQIEIGDYVVHEEYGVAIYGGLKQELVDGSPRDYLLLKYAKEDELYVPLNQLKKITKYLGTDDSEPKLTRLGTVTWKNITNKIKKSTQLLARELVEHYAKRELSNAKPIKNNDSEEYLEFLTKFPYEETSDQSRAIGELVSDLSSDRPMNRLLVGDVGFGKTEVAMRTAFKIVEQGGQVAILAPTTVLTAQHYEVFKERFKDFPVTVEYLSRFNESYKNREIIDKLNEGKVDIVIGTHRLLSSDVRFKNLELLVVDEEQKFGVKQKEKIKKLNYGVHVLSVSATPIPRTLSMALSSIQDISVISEPPKGRKSIKTEIIKDDWDKAVQAIISEVDRGGQVYFLHNKVQSIQSIKAKLEKLAPGIRFVVGHGQMDPKTLSKVIVDFYEEKYDCLICTTIIENGIDMPNVNTIVINKAHEFGLSQLYQLRGRVGRSPVQAYCYLFYEGKSIAQSPELIAKNFKNTQDYTDYLLAQKKIKSRNYLDRLQTLVDNQELGSGFRIASKDLEIRGAGSLLGDQQHGYISSVGYALYVQLLAQEIARLKRFVVPLPPQ